MCDGDIADPYVANAPDDRHDYKNRRQAVSITADQILNNAEYAVWDGLDAVTIGCDWGGTMTLTPTDVDTRLAFDHCEFTDRFPLSGRGAIDANGVVHLGRVTTPVG